MSGRRRGEHLPAAEDSIARVMAGWQLTRPDLDVAPIAVTARLSRLQQTLGSQLERVFAAHGLSGGDFAVLATIVRCGSDPLSQKRLMGELNLTAGTISVRIDRLVKNGLVRRGFDPDDRRGWLIELTPSGRKVFEACAPEHLANARQLVGVLTAEERDRLAALLGKLAKAPPAPAVYPPGTPFTGELAQIATTLKAILPQPGHRTDHLATVRPPEDAVHEK